ncbi:MAG: methyltransferase domain-containing protein [Anaerolineales bacterium]|nr:methyltransferase domain-containing protein [Anaerolineales bacterium]
MSFDETYFSSHAYQHVSFARFSQYWWANRFYAILARRYGRRGRLLEIGSGLGHLVGLLEGTFQTFAADINPWALVRSKDAAAGTSHALASAEELPYRDGIFEVVIIKHVVEHLAHPERAIAELGRLLVPGGTLILSAPNLASVARPWKKEKWIGYQDPTHIALKEPDEWLELLRGGGFCPRRIFSDGLWDAPYLPVVPKVIQKLAFGLPGGMQAVTGIVFVPLRWGETMVVIAQKESTKKSTE